ncbi:putative chalcone isomerase [Rosa chinensis]|uniref:Chalcone-flavonone isomerase family protein n=1 Tax=Rosa chinensis TaxID=74649 RepID=A0A2P6PD03_ROSCH|nr:putative chalcone isomerase [Rosa chinensis]
MAQSVTGIQVEETTFPPAVKPPGSANTLFLGGAGARGLEIQGNFVRFTAIGVYLEDKAGPALAVKWSGRVRRPRSPLEKFTQVTMILPLTGQQYSEKVSENCVAIW